MDYKSFYKTNARQRIKFTQRFDYFYKTIGEEINKIIDLTSNILLLSAGHSRVLDNLKFNKALVSEIANDFHNLYKKKNNISIFNSELDSKNLEHKKIDEVLITNLEYSDDPIKLMDKINEFIELNGKVTVICNNVFWNPFFKLCELINLKFKHPRKNLITSNFMHNLCFLTNYDLIKKKKIILFPFKLPLLSFFLNSIIVKLPFINFFGLVNLYTLRTKKKSNLKLENLNISVIVPCKNEEKNIKLVIDSFKKIGKKTELLFGDDKSTDNTKSEIVKYLNSKKDLEIKYYEGPGICKAENVYKGFNIASGDILVIHDADNTVHPNELEKIISILVNKNQNLVIGTRFVYPMEKKAMKVSNYFGNLFFSYFYSFILQKKITDTLCGTKVLFKNDWKKIEKYCGSWGFKDKWGDFDLLSGAKRNMMKISEVPVNYRERIAEETKMTNTIFNGIRMLIICISSFVRLRL